MKNVTGNARWWIAGALAAFGGVALARLVAPSLAASPARVGCTIAGQLLALAGLVFISIGVSRRVRGNGASSQ